MRQFAIVLFIVAASGCTTWRDYSPVRLVNISPEYVTTAGDRRVARTGEYFLTSWRIAERETAIIKNETVVEGENHKRLFGSISVKSHKFTVKLPSGVAILEARDRDGDRYYSLPGGVTYKYGRWRTRTVPGGLVVPTQSSSPARLFWRPPDVPGLVISSVPDNEPIVFTSGGKHRKLVEFNGFGQTITYIGLSNKQIRFVYKEFDGSMIRNAFTQEFTFDFVPEQEYGYKNSRFIVHRASPTDIEYTVLSAFDD